MSRIIPGITIHDSDEIIGAIGKLNSNLTAHRVVLYKKELVLNKVYQIKLVAEGGILNVKLLFIPTFYPITKELTICQDVVFSLA